METKKSKYDTNPLDPDFVKNAERSFGPEGDATGRPDTQEVRGATREIGSTGNKNARANAYSEAPTRRYDNVPLDAPYPSIFVPPTYSQPTPYQPAPTPYQPPPAPYHPLAHHPGSRTVAGIGLPEKWATLLVYTPFYLGVVVALIELFLVPRKEVRVRYHAAQALALHIVIVVAQTLFGGLGKLTGSSFGGSLFGLAAFVFLIVSMIRVWKGKPHHIAPLADPAQWFNEHIEPRNKS
jgi:uncharacterized membrane protein